MKKTEHIDIDNISLIYVMYSDAVSYFKPQNPSLFNEYDVKFAMQERIDEARRMIRDGAPSVEIFVRRDGSVEMHGTDFPMYNLKDVVFLYEIRLNANQLFDVVRYDYSDEDEAQKDVKKEEYGVEYKGTTYVFHNVYERDLVESMSRLIKHKGDDVSGTEFGYMIQFVFRLLDVDSDWLLRM